MLLGFNSTTSDFKVAEKFMSRNSDQTLCNVIMEIVVGEKTKNKPVNISIISDYKGEMEYLMQLNVFLIVNAIKLNESNIIIETEITSFEELK